MKVSVSSEGKLDGDTNMSRDNALLSSAESGNVAARIYFWNGPWVTLGRFQSPDKDLIQPSRTPWVLRPTGGKAVLHGHDLTVGLAVPLSLLSVADQRSIKSIYRVVILPIVQALKACGVSAALAEETPYSKKGRHTADCFTFSSPNDVVDELTGQKLCGCALRLTHRAVLVQASIPNGPPLVDPTKTIVNADSSCGTKWNETNFVETFENSLIRLVGAVNRQESPV